MGGLGMDKEVEQNRLYDRLNMGPEDREELMLVSGCGDWASGWMGRMEGEGKCKGSLWSLSPLWWLTLFFVMDLAYGAALPTPMLGDLRFKTNSFRSSVMSQGGPARRCKLGPLFTFCSHLVVVADFSGRNNRIRLQGTQETYNQSPASELGNCPLCVINPRCKPCILF